MKKIQSALDELQVAHLGPSPTRDQIGEYFNACLNSACGAVQDKYGHVAVLGLLMLWQKTVEDKMAKDRPA